MEDISLKSVYADTMEIVKLEAETNETSVEDELTNHILDYLKFEGLVSSPTIISCQNEQSTKDVDFYKINGFDYSEETGVLDLIITHYIDKEELPEFTKAKIEKCHNALYRFVMLCIESDSLYKEYKEKDPDIAEIIETIKSEYEKGDISQVRFFILSNGLNKSEYELSDETVIGKKEIPLEEYVWDLEMVRQSEQASRKEPFVDIDLESQFSSLECILCDENAEVKSYLAVIPARILAEIYNKYRSRLLNNNVRNYLGGRGRKNQAMIKSLRTESQLFFAYNNGISSTAFGVKTKVDNEGRLFITGLHNWQIVNGGQTTNVIYYLYSNKKERYLLDGVNVAVKITEIKISDEERRKQTISNIARYANSQNQVKESDFAVNEPFMHSLKELSLKETTPQSSIRPGTKWFFIRMRGEYEDSKTNLSGRKQLDFLRQNPKNQVLEKADLAKLEMAWNQQPYISCQGGEKCFDSYWKTINKQKDLAVDDKFFHRLIAKQIIIQRVKDVFLKSGLKGYCNIYQYYALSIISLKSREQLDLDYIWDHQDVQPLLIPIIEKSVDIVGAYIKLLATSSDNVNISSAAKKSDFFKAISLRLGGIPEFDSTLMTKAEKIELTMNQKAEIAEFDEITVESWESLAEWGKSSRKLSLLERKKVEHIAVAKEKQKELSYNNISEVLSIYLKAKNMGWSN